MMHTIYTIEYFYIVCENACYIHYTYIYIYPYTRCITYSMCTIYIYIYMYKMYHTYLMYTLLYILYIYNV